MIVLLYGCLLLATCVVIHAWGLAFLTQHLRDSHPKHKESLFLRIWLVVKVAWSVILLHVLCIAVWAVFYAINRCFPDYETALYFSGVTYTTVGFGDVVLPQKWQMLGPMQGLTGILMCGFSTAYFFAVALKIVEFEETQEKSSPKPSSDTTS